MKHTKTLAGIICLLIMGFISFTLISGFGVLIGFVVVIFPTWQIVVGTLFGSLGVFLYLIRDKKK